MREVIAIMSDKELKRLGAGEENQCHIDDSG